MGSSFYLSADPEQAGPWTFTGEQVQECVRRHWPDATVSTAFEGFLEIVADLDRGRPAEVSFNLQHGMFAFEDRGSLVGPLTVIYNVLHDLAPEVPVVWWIDYDVDPQPLDLAGGLEAFIGSFPG
ncbi:hypothetical protein [Kitasatospora brasiliensis]|uniref:hypothetical protein n=1 Tax=Kitasatospora brasiliensis TaxID=3058040 RepID=UPI00292CDDC2|nr:hypothetical protein [Kitasatospora sp. K002]